jgi:diaminopimelate epimerase
MDLEFFKYQGTGNDFIIINEQELEHDPDQESIKFLCNRHKGIGADGVIIIGSHPVLDFSMKFMNPDGSEGSFCGNGGRCAVMYYDIMTGDTGQYKFAAIDGEHSGEIVSRSGNSFLVKISLKDVRRANITNHPEGVLINTGAPHLVVKAKRLDKLNIKELARPVRFSEKFAPEGVNVNFIENTNEGILIRTFEKGVENETLSCGTGVTAAALVNAGSKAENTGKVNVITRGGTLRVTYMSDKTHFKNVQLEGPADYIYKGIISV